MKEKVAYSDQNYTADLRSIAINIASSPGAVLMLLLASRSLQQPLQSLVWRCFAQLSKRQVTEQTRLSSCSQQSCLSYVASMRCTWGLREKEFSRFRVKFQTRFCADVLGSKAYWNVFWCLPDSLFEQEEEDNLPRICRDVLSYPCVLWVLQSDLMLFPPTPTIKIRTTIKEVLGLVLSLGWVWYLVPQDSPYAPAGLHETPFRSVNCSSNWKVWELLVQKMHQWWDNVCLLILSTFCLTNLECQFPLQPGCLPYSLRRLFRRKVHKFAT